MTDTEVRDLRTAALLRALSWFAILAMIPIVFFFTSRGTWSPRYGNTDAAWSADFFRSQAQSMLRGRLDVASDDIIGECFERDARCYGYFGVTPSLIRMPVIGILRYARSALTPMFLSLAIILGYWATLQMLQRSLRESPTAVRSSPLAIGYFIVGALALGPGGSLLFVSRPAVYEEAIAWAVAFVLLAFNHVWAWRSGERRGIGPALLFAVAAANARPTAALVALVLGLAVLALVRYRRASVADRSVDDAAARTATRRLVTAAICLSVLPASTVGGVFWLKLRSPMPSPLLNRQVATAPHWKAIRRRNGGRTGGLVFAPTELVAYFRPDTVVRRHEWPYLDFRFPNEKIWWVPPLREGGAYVERVTSVTTTMPLPWIVNLLLAAWLIVQGRRLIAGSGAALTGEDWIFSVGLLASAAAMPLLILTTHGITNRYLGDFFPLSAVGVALAPRLVLPRLAGRRLLCAAAALVALLLVSWSVVVTLSLNCRLVF